VANITQVRDQLKANAVASGDKTGQVYSPSTGPAAIVDLFFGGSTGLEQFLSLSNANHFWLPMIPSFSPAPPYLYEFAFSLPYPPDNASYSSGGSTEAQLNALGNQMKTAAANFKQALTALTTAQTNYSSNPSAANLSALNAAQSAYDTAQGVLNDLNQQSQALAGPRPHPSSRPPARACRGCPRPAPRTRAEPTASPAGTTRRP